MIIIPEAVGQTYLVFGLGKTGKATTSSLLASGAYVILTDDAINDQSLTTEFAASDPAFKNALAKKQLIFLPQEEIDWKTITTCILSPGISLLHPIIDTLKQYGCPYISDLDLLYEASPEARYVGITGSNGKSTTTALTYHLLSSLIPYNVQLGGNIGVASLNLAPAVCNDCYVLELSSALIDLSSKLKLDVAILLNITPDHIAFHGSYEAYIQAKAKIFSMLKPHGIGFINIDYAPTAALYEKLKPLLQHRLIPLSTQSSLKNGISCINTALVDDAITHDTYTLPTIQPLPGAHNKENILGSLATSLYFGYAFTNCLDLMHKFEGLAHRLQHIAQIKGIRFINDSKATNAEAAEKALLSYDHILWIAGGKAKEGGITMLKPLLRAPKLLHTFLIGDASDMFADTLDQANALYTRSGTLASAVKQAYDMALKLKQDYKDPVILLSPACASFDQWKNFEARGEGFITYVKALESPNKRVYG